MPSLSDLLGLCKLKVIALLLLTAVVGMLLATSNFPDWLLILNTNVGIGMAASSTVVFNNIVDEKIDIQMARTSQRALLQGKVDSKQALVWGLFLATIGLSILYFFVNTLTTILTFFSLIGYAVIYTSYLKRATPQNIVIGGMAGAAVPVLGWVAVTGDIHLHALLLF